MEESGYHVSNIDTDSSKMNKSKKMSSKSLLVSKNLLKLEPTEVAQSEFNANSSSNPSQSKGRKTVKI